MEKGCGFVQDVTADLKTGTITSIIVPGSNKLINMFAGNNDIVIPWENVKCIRRRYYIGRNLMRNCRGDLRSSVLRRTIQKIPQKNNKFF